MDILEITKSIMWIGLTILFVLSSVSIMYVLIKTGRLLRRVETDLHRTVDEFVPILTKTSVSMDQVNRQLAKVDLMMDSAVDITSSVDTTVRAVSHAITEPVKAVSSAVTGATETARSFSTRFAETQNTDSSDSADSADYNDPFDSLGD